ncbi:MAG: hypothetical protein O3A55_01420 [Bacteroidetes bacterium]|nr:hypothetical protein [Bacteroidota bacterium]
MNDVKAMTSVNNILWVATTGGVYKLNQIDSTVTKFTNVDGLSSNDATAIEIDKNGLVWIGSLSGMIDVLDPTTNSINSIKDIFLSLKNQKGINNFYNSGDTMFIATDFGVSLYSLSRKEFLDTYNNFGDFSQTMVYDVLSFNGQLFLATEKGIAVSKINATNLSAPESWQTTFNKSTSLCLFDNKMFAATTSGVFSLINNEWSVVNNLNQPSLKLIKRDSLIYIFQENTIKQFSKSGVINQYGPTSINSLTDGVISSQKQLLVGIKSNGVAQLQNNKWLIYSPNSPSKNYFSSVAIDKNGDIWATSGRSSGYGFYRYNGSTWTNYNVDTEPKLKSNDFFNITITPTNEKLISSWGKGIVLVSKEGKVLKTFDNNYPGFAGADDPTFIVSGGNSFDKENNLWISLYRPTTLNVLWKMTPDSVWTSYKTSLNNNYINILGLFIDNNGTKWFINSLTGFTPNALCVFYNDKINIANTSDNWGIITDANGLTNSQITSIVGGKDGDIWLGTTSGISIINNPTTPTKNISKVYLGVIREQMINCMAVDGINNKWIGTPQGIYCLSPDGTILINHYSTSTTSGKLVSNNILSLAIDEQKGIVYAGTDKGLSSFTIPFIVPSEKLDKLSISPQPFRITNNNAITISGLTKNCLIKILSSSGTLINQFDAQGGGQGFWDGKDNVGNFVSSGIYFAIAYDLEGAKVGYAKIAIIR